MAQYINATTILHNGMYIPVDTRNRDYRELIASGVTITPLPAVDTLAEWRAGAKVSRFQAKEQLRTMGLLTAANTIAQGAGGKAYQAWQDAQEFRRLSPTINQLAPALRPDLTGDALEEWKDQFFRDAMLIEA